MTHPSPASRDFYVGELRKLVHGQVVQIVYDNEGFLGLRIAFPNKEYVLWLLSDDEGNCPGSFYIDEGET